MKQALLLVMLFCSSLLLAEEQQQSPADSLAIKTDTLLQGYLGTKDESVDSLAVAEDSKTGWNFGPLPFGAYDNDLSLQLGALLNIYDYGDGKIYPNFYHSFYLEASYYLNHSGVFQFNYLSNYLIPKHGFKFDISYLPDAMSDFYGYNGYQSVYQPDWLVNDTIGGYTRLFYKYKRNILRTMVDIDGEIAGKWRWTAGIGLYWYDVSSVNTEFLNRTRKSDPYPAVDGLYEKYTDWGLIRHNATRGGVHPYLRAGVVYDSRDQVSNPNKGIYADAFFTYSAAFRMGNYMGVENYDQREYNNLVFNFNFRHYITLYPRYLNLAYRVGLQNTLCGKQPFYANSIMNVLYQQRTMYEALGGSSSVRGMLRNRVMAKGFAFANVELRAVFVRFKIKRQHFYVGANPFFDIGVVTQPHVLSPDMEVGTDAEGNPQTLQQRMSASGMTDEQIGQYFDFAPTKFGTGNTYLPHMSAGIGLKLAMNENFVISADWAAPLDKRDNKGLDNFYISIGYLF